MADRWLDNYVEIELEKHSEPKVNSTLQKMLDEGYRKVDTNLRHFEVYAKGCKRILYNPIKEEIDMIYSTKKVFGGFRSVNFSSKDLGAKE